VKFKADEIASVVREEIARYRSQLSRGGAVRLKSGETARVIQQEVDRFRREMDVAHVGRVLEVGDGIARIYGLSDAMAGEMLEFANGEMGQVFNLEEGSVGAVIYGSCEEIKAGQTIRGTGKLLSVAVGQALIGRVVDPLGRPLDGRGDVVTAQSRPLEMPAPGIAERQPVHQPLESGLKAIDAMTPIGRGQRELIIGDRKTGKTAIAVDTMINQAGGDVLCVYVAIGQKDSTVAGVVETLREHGAMDHCVVVSASSSDPAPLQYVAPYAGCAIAEHFMIEKGLDTLVVYDDLTKQAAAYREISLLLRRPPGREAYPGDVFYLHSRLLERACKLADRYAVMPADTPEDFADVGRHRTIHVGPLGRQAAERERQALDDPDAHKVHRLPSSGGSMTALPICETQEGEVAAYIPTNLISITDGQIYLEPGDRGERLVRVLTQPQYQPLPVVDQVVALYAATRGYVDEIDVDQVSDFEAGLRHVLRTDHVEFRDELAADLDLTGARERRLQRILDAYKERFYSKVRRVRQPAPPADIEAPQP